MLNGRAYSVGARAAEQSLRYNRKSMKLTLAPGLAIKKSPIVGKGCFSVTHFKGRRKDCGVHWRKNHKR